MQFGHWTHAKMTQIFSESTLVMIRSGGLKISLGLDLRLEQNGSNVVACCSVHGSSLGPLNLPAQSQANPINRKINGVYADKKCFSVGSL
jgi:hypothetical protein